MASENVFSTPRKEQLTADQMLENAIRLKNERQRNVIAMMEANKLRNSNKDFTTTMEATNADVEKQLAKDSAMEAAAYKIGSRNVAMAQLGLRQKMIQEGTEYITNKVLGELIYECYWLDDPVKECTVEEIGENIENVLGYIEESFKDSKVNPKQYSKLMENLSAVIKETAEKAADRICKECEDSDGAFRDFELTDAEEEELDDKLIDLGRDEIVDLIKTKVAAVVQDEKEKGEARSEMFKAIDEMSKTEEESSDKNSDNEQLTDAEESMIRLIQSGELPITEGVNIKSLKIYFSGLRKRASTSCKLANSQFKAGNYKEAKKNYQECLDIFNDVQKRLDNIDENFISDVLSWTVAYATWFILPTSLLLVDSQNTKGLKNSMPTADANGQIEKDKDGVKFKQTNNFTKAIIITNITRMRKYCIQQIKECDKLSKNGGETEKVQYKYSLESNSYTSAEKHMAKILESEAEVRLFDDPTWSEFKSYVSLQCKHIKDCLGKEKPDYECVICLIDDFEKRLEGVPENIPADTKMYVMAMVNMIFSAVPPTEIIISRFGNPLGSPDLQASSPIVDYSTISWMDLFVNIKTNLSSVKDFCKRKADECIIDEDHLNNSDCPDTGKNSLAQKIAQAQSRIIAQNIGGSLFESMMIGAISTCEKAAMESSSEITDENVENAALIESILNYTIFETLDTIGMYKFHMGDIKQAKKAFMYPTLEGIGIMSSGNNKKGLKKVRINTKKMKQKKFIVGDTDKPGILTGKK